ncbi:MAG: choice-of-anchor Q domain-containing protein, partial [Planctomycetota bacterium]
GFFAINDSIFQGGVNDFSFFGGQLTSSNRVLDVDPQFADPDGADNDILTSDDNDFSLLAISPAIDDGDNAGLPVDHLDVDRDADTSETVPFDLVGLARITNLDVDLGAIEYCPYNYDGTAPVDMFDVLRFLNDAEANDPAADLNGSGLPVDQLDVTEFMNGVESGACNPN